MVLTAPDLLAGKALRENYPRGLRFLMMIDERKRRRSHVTAYLKICYGDNEYELGRVVDISTEGMRLCGAEPIQTDRILSFRLTIPATSRAAGDLSFDAEVIWCRRAKNTGLYHTGIKIRYLRPEMVESIENFLEKSSREDRWLSVIKSIQDYY